MSDSKSSDELPELPDMPGEALPDLPDLPDMPAEEAPVVAAGGKPPLREMVGAPLHLQKAALIAIAGGLLPWNSFALGGPVTWAVGKLLIAAGIWLLWKSVDQRNGDIVPGFIKSLGDIVLGPKAAEEDPKTAARRAARQKGPVQLKVPFPTALHLIGLVVVLIGISMPFFDSGHSPVIEHKLKTLAELGMFAWALGTWVHIYAYERWGSFNPIFPLIFIGMLVAGGVTSVQAVMDDRGIQILPAFGGLIVAIGGGMAAFTIVEAMMEAKKEGDAKKNAETDRRKAARTARKS